MRVKEAAPYNRRTGAPRKSKRCKDDIRLLRVQVNPILGKLPITSGKKHEIIRLRDAIATGALVMMNLTAPIRIEKNADQKMPTQPDYRFLAGDIETEIGGGWIVQAQSIGREYISLTLVEPQIGPRKVQANLAPAKGRKGRYVLL